MRDAIERVMEQIRASASSGGTSEATMRIVIRTALQTLNAIPSPRSVDPSDRRVLLDLGSTLPDPLQRMLRTALEDDRALREAMINRARESVIRNVRALLESFGVDAKIVETTIESVLVEIGRR